MDEDILIRIVQVYSLQIWRHEVELFTVLHHTPFNVSPCAFLTAHLYGIQMKLPSSVGQKKIKAIEQILLEQGVGKCKY